MLKMRLWKNCGEVVIDDALGVSYCSHLVSTLEKCIILNLISWAANYIENEDLIWFSLEASGYGYSLVSNVFSSAGPGKAKMVGISEKSTENDTDSSLAQREIHLQPIMWRHIVASLRAMDGRFLEQRGAKIRPGSMPCSRRATTPQESIRVSKKRTVA